MSVQRIASRYAKSLIDLANEQDKLERVKEDVDTFREVTRNRDFYLFLKNPIVNADKKWQVVQKIFSKSYDELTMAFLEILVKKGRESYLPEIADEFLVQYKTIKHISTVSLTTASPLSEETLTRLRKTITDSTVTDDIVELEVNVDPYLIGGFIVEMKGMVFDSSVAHRLDEFRKEFKENLYVSQVVSK